MCVVTFGCRVRTSGDGHSAGGRPLSLEELTPYIDAVRGIPLAPRLRINARGTMEALTGDITVESKAGNVSSTFSGGIAAGESRFRGNATMSDLNIAPWFRRPDLPSRSRDAPRSTSRFPATLRIVSA
jgi:hypothetical protein